VEQLPPEHPAQLLPDEDEDGADAPVSLESEAPPFLNLQAEISFPVFSDLHSGQGGHSSRLKTSSSNSFPQSAHLYSYIGMNYSMF
jgi:hypothetical protein